MAVATLFESEKIGAPAGGKRGNLMALLTGGLGTGHAQPSAPARSETAPAAPQTEASANRQANALDRGSYVRGLEIMIRHTERTRLNQTLVEVTPREVQALVEKAAKAKARYLAAALELGSGEAMPDSGALRSLELERERHEALQAALHTLMEELRRGNIEVEGVVDAPRREPEAQ